MIYRINNITGVQAELSAEESEVISKCNFVTEITPNGETWQYNHCYLLDCIILWNVSVKYIKDIPCFDKLNKAKEIYVDLIKILMIDKQSPKYTAILYDGSVLNGICRNDEQTKDINKAVDEWAGISHEEQEEPKKQEPTLKKMKAELFFKFMDIYIEYQNNDRNIAKTAKALNYTVGYVRRAIMTINNFAGLGNDVN